MIQFAPNSKWPRRIRNIFIAIAVIVALEAIVGHFSKRWIADNGGEKPYRTRLKLKGILIGLDSYHFIQGKYPASQEAFKQVFDPPKDDKKFHLPHLSKEPRHVDAWNRDFRYLFPGIHNKDSFDLWSAGADGKDDTDDDITNWEPEGKPRQEPASTP